MRTTTKTITFGGTHRVPEGWDLIVKCKLKSGDKWLRPWGEWALIPKTWHGEYHTWRRDYFIREKQHLNTHITKLIDVVRRSS